MFFFHLKRRKQRFFAQTVLMCLGTKKICENLFVFVASGVRRKFSWGVSFSGIWWSFVFAVRCLWRHKMTSYSCFQTYVLRSLLT